MGLKHVFYRSLGMGVAALALAVSPAFSEELNDWAFDSATNELMFALPDDILPEFFLLSEPARLILEIPDTEVGDIPPEQLYSGAVQSIRVSQYTPDLVRVVIELAPEIVLTPEQADIQFDARSDGQRLWSFRPLIDATGSTVAAASTLTDSVTDSGPDRASLSAANLQLSDQRSAAAVLPIDPYEAESTEGVVSVPPLEDFSEDRPAAATAPDLPLMTVPQLEETDLDGAEVPTVAAVSDDSRQSLPDISSTSPQSDITPAAEPLNPGQSEVPDAVATDNNAAIEENVPIADAAPDDLATVPDDVGDGIADGIEAEILEGDETNAVAAAPEVENFEDPGDAVVEPLSEEALPEETIAAAPQPTAAALAPVQLSRSAVESVEPANPMVQTIRQPAAERTIVQIEPPEPLTFGQPLPNRAR